MARVGSRVFVGGGPVVVGRSGGGGRMVGSALALDPPLIVQWGSIFVDFGGFPLPTNLCPHEPITK